MTRRGFTIVELIIVITVIGILLTLAVVSLNGTQAKARDDERKADIESIAAYLESFHTNGPVSSEVPTVTNLITNPSFELNTTNWATDGGQPAVVRDTTTAYRGSASERLSSTGGSQYFYSNPSMVPASPGQTYTASIFVKGTGTVRVNFRSCAGSCGALIGQSPIYTLSDRWQRMSVTGTTGAGAERVYMGVVQLSGGSQTVYSDAAMITETSYLTDYVDGTTPGGSWSGTAHASTSTGPALAAAPGSYPGAGVVQESLLKMYLPDIDVRSFRAPGVDNVADSFILATNTTETTSGVAPQPTIDQYVYQPLTSDGSLCFSYGCRKFNLFYRLEGDNTVYKYESKNR